MTGLPKNNAESVAITLQSASNITSGTATIATWTRKQALQKASLGGLLCWGLALAGLPIPIVHFLVVPLGLMLGPIVAFALYKIYYGARDLTGGGGPCPNCAQTLTLPSTREHWPQRLHCPNCHQEIFATVSQC